MYMKEYFEMTGQTIKISDIPHEMYGGVLPIAKSRRSKKRAMTEAEYVEDAPEQDAKKAKKSKAIASQEKPADPEVLTIQQEASGHSSVIQEEEDGYQEAEASKPGC